MAADELTITTLLRRNATEFGDLPALTATVDGVEQTLGWLRVRERVAGLAHGLAAIGLRRSDRLLIMMSSRPEHWLVDLAAVHIGAIPCTAYATLAGEQIGYVARHSGATVVVLEGADELARWRPDLAALPALRSVVLLDATALPTDDPRFVSFDAVTESGDALHQQDPGRFEEWTDLVAPTDPVAMMYTSGTTGDPKGVVLSHRNVIRESMAIDEVSPMPMHMPCIAYLPLAHIAERELSIYRAIHQGAHVTICHDPSQVAAALRAVAPPAFFGVPRVWEKMAAGLRGALDAAEPAQRAAVEAASELRLRAYRLRADGQPVPDDLAEQVEAADLRMLRPIRAVLGLADLTWASSGSAPLPLDVLLFLAGLGIEIQEVWGLSETTGSATANTPDAFRPGSVGRALPGVDLRIAEDGEIFVRGPIVFLGYLDADGDVRPGTDADGWLATGDIGTLDEDGYLTITDRKKELIITSGGKNIAPSPVESLLRAHPLVGQAVVIGDRRPYLVALLVLDDESAPRWAERAGITDTGPADLAGHPALLAELDALVAGVNARLSRVEQVKTYRVLGTTWTAESGELTPTLKLRRRVITQRYASDIDGLYGSHG